MYCDCKCLSDVFKSNNLPGTASLRNWVARLLHYNPKVLHQPGKAMAIPDALSRAHTVEYRPDDDDPAQRLLGSIFDSAYTHKENEEESLKTQKEIYEQSQVLLEQDVFGDTGEIRLLILPTLVKTSPSSGGVDNDRVSNFLAQAQRDDPYWIEIIDYIQYGLVPRTRARAAFVRLTAHSYMIDKKGILRKLFIAKKEGMDKTQGIRHLIFNFWRNSKRNSRLIFMDLTKRFRKRKSLTSLKMRRTGWKTHLMMMLMMIWKNLKLQLLLETKCKKGLNILKCNGKVIPSKMLNGYQRVTLILRN